MSKGFPENNDFSKRDLDNKKITFVVSKFNEDIVSRLLNTTKERLLV